ncbi:hypothetical protein Cgig2_024984 [Carnegiea gigantea]|uniref:DUF7781 domain-containing protein n=1 Tax=Carnegiea gigantea TaxID=171969 RepID=A0A9Q1JL67_9CARY|nr:hypothetical protein Cgig2_024984 [Carnegiea gigantea]
MDPDPGVNGDEPAPWELYNIDLVPSEVFLKFRKEIEEYRLGVNVELVSESGQLNIFSSNAQGTYKTSTRLSKIEEILGATDGLEVAQEYTILGGLAMLVGQVREMNNMLMTLLEKDKGPSRSNSDTEDSPYLTTNSRKLLIPTNKVKNHSYQECLLDRIV